MEKRETLSAEQRAELCLERIRRIIRLWKQNSVRSNVVAVGAIMHVCMKTLSQSAAMLLLAAFLCGSTQAATTAEQLKAWRTSQGYTQAQAATKVGVSASSWSAWESGVREPSAYNRATLVNIGALPATTATTAAAAPTTCPTCATCADRCGYDISLAPGYKCEQLDVNQDGTVDTFKCGGHDYVPCAGRSAVLLSPEQVAALPNGPSLNPYGTFRCN